MTTRTLVATVRAAALAVVALATLAVSQAHAVCTYYSIDTTQTYAVTENPQIVELHQTQPVWSAFAIRPQAGDDWDVSLYQNTAGDPTCVATPLASSTYGGAIVDFVIGDYSYDPAGYYYVTCNHFSGVNFGYVRWRESPQVLTVNALPTIRNWGGSDVIETWNLQLEAGKTYTINFGVFAGAMDAKVLLFRNPAASTYWAGRPSAVLTTNTTTTYTAPSTGTYAIVVVNDDGGAGSFSLQVGACLAPVALTAATPVHSELYLAHHQFTQSFLYWTAVGVRNPAIDYDITVWGGTAGGGYPACLSDPKASSVYGAGTLDFVVGDFNHNPTGTYYTQLQDFSSTGGADLEWDSGPDLLTVNAAPITRAWDGSQVLEVWDVFLSAGQTYNFAFNTSLGCHLLLFRNAGGGVYWSGRSGAQFDVQGCASYVAPSSGYYGVVVVNENAAPANFSLGVSQAPCYCPVTLVPNTPTSSPSPDTYYRFDSNYNDWGVVATRGFTVADDWDLTVSDQATGNPSPACLGTTLTSSAYGASLVDIGVIDFNHTPLGGYYARTHHFSGAALAGLTEWDPDHGVLYPNGPYQTAAMGPNDLAHAWDAWMIAGTTYQIEFAPSGGSGFQLLTFENAGGGSYIVNRASAVLTTAGNATYTPTVTGYHGFVVVNDAAGNGSYVLRYGACAAPTALVSLSSVGTPTSVETYSFAQPANQWGAVGVRSTFADWDIRSSATLTGPFPNCIGGSLATSSSATLSFVDFVVGDFFHNPAGTYYAAAYQYTNGTPYPTRSEWSAGQGDILVNDNNDIARDTDGFDVLQSWSVYMSAGLSYTFNFNHTGGSTLHLLLFRNVGGGVYWTSRIGNVADVTAGGGPFTYVAPSTGEYGVVVVNDPGLTDHYTLNVKTCFAPTALVSGVVATDLPENFHSFNQTAIFWTAVGVRSTSDWDIDVNSLAGGGAPGVCQSGLLASSTGVGVADFVVGDFNGGGNATGTYYARDFRFSGSAAGTVEWDSGSDLIGVNSPPVHRNTDASDVLEVWDVRLLAGQTYTVFFEHYGLANTKVLLFRNPGGAYWAPRSSSVYQNTTHGHFTAPSTGYYGLVVVNDNGAAGSYNVGVVTTALAANPNDAPRITALRSIQPNPVRSGMRVEYSLSQRAPVHVQLLDLAGRVVADMDNQMHEAGVWQAGWNGVTNAGRRAAPGIYMVRLEVDGRAIGQRKVTVLE